MAPGLRSKLDPKSTAQQVITSSIDGNESFLDAINGFEMVNTNDLGPKESKGPILGSNSTTAETGVNRPGGKGRVPVGKSTSQQVITLPSTPMNLSLMPMTALRWSTPRI